MMLPRKEAEKIESAIERRLIQTMASGGVRPFSNVGPVRKASSMGTGLFLVKSTAEGYEAKAPEVREKSRASARAARLEGLAEKHRRDKRDRGQVIAMEFPEKQARQERLLGLMAALGPMLWFGHAALVWLKVV